MITNSLEILTERELEVLKLVTKGLNNNEIAEIIVVSVHTVKAHVCSIFNKLKVSSRVQAAVKAVELGIMNYPHSFQKEE